MLVIGEDARLPVCLGNWRSLMNTYNIRVCFAKHARLAYQSIRGKTFKNGSGNLDLTSKIFTLSMAISKNEKQSGKDFAKHYKIAHSITLRLVGGREATTSPRDFMPASQSCSLVVVGKKVQNLKHASRFFSLTESAPGSSTV